MKLLCGLYKPTEGEIRIDGKAIGDYEKESYYGLISSVFQNVQLLPLTIAENVSSGTKENMDREKVINCLKLAGLWEKIEAFPDKENTSLGNGIQKNAVGLSGGEQQKLWMARAFYKEAPLLILDEPTAALDPLAEQEVMRNMCVCRRGEHRCLFLTGCPAPGFVTGSFSWKTEVFWRRAVMNSCLPPAGHTQGCLEFKADTIRRMYGTGGAKGIALAANKREEMSKDISCHLRCAEAFVLL